MKELKNNSMISSSFRDPSGFLFYKDGVIYRQVNLRYQENYNNLIKSGLYNALIEDGLLISHGEVEIKSTKSNEILPVEPGEAEWNLDVIEALFDFYFIQPDIIKSKKDQLNKKLAEAGKKPMK